MRSLVKYIVGRTYRPLLVKYLAKTRTYHYKGLVLEIPPQVFHPRFFFSTRLLLKHLSSLSLRGQKFLELGAGSGLISVYAAAQGARVTASDISSVAIRALVKNRLLNKTKFDIIHSDLFQSIPSTQFDIIAINPPYYKKRPVSQGDHAWYCGEEGEYFLRLFKEIREFTHPASKVLMILCDGCDLSMIHGMAEANNIGLKEVGRKGNLIERNFIYELQMHHD